MNTKREIERIRARAQKQVATYVVRAKRDVAKMKARAERRSS